MTLGCAAAAVRLDHTPCDGSPMAVVLRYEDADFGGTAGCPHHANLLAAEHPGSAVVPIEETLAAMSVFNGHPDLSEMDDDLDTRYPTTD